MPQLPDMIVKVCGMRDPKNIAALVELDIDWVGLIFYDKSPRYVDGALDAVSFNGLSRVGVFVDESLGNIRNHTFRYGLNMIQLHGSESPEFCREVMSLGVKVIKALPVADRSDMDVAANYEGSVDHVLLDTKSQSKGGSGLKFGWSMLAAYGADIPFLLSGGIGPEDAPEIKKINHPQFAGVDLNSRFEVSPGLKDVDRIKSFVKALRKEANEV